jgi:hypothetical protein
MENWTHEGYWYDLQIASSTAFIRKMDDETKITITAGVAKKTATIPAEHLKGKSISKYLSIYTREKAPTNAQPIDVGGILWFKDITKVQLGKFASYNDDRIVFYESDWNSKDFIAYVRDCQRFVTWLF